MIRYCCGFLFDISREYVALIIKNKPEWQDGKVNGIGGKVETEESFLHAQAREFEEETGVQRLVWERLCEYKGEDYELVFFRSFDDRVFDVKSMEGEKVIIVELDRLQEYDLIYNLNWLIPLALDTKLSLPITIEEKENKNV